MPLDSIPTLELQIEKRSYFHFGEYFGDAEKKLVAIASTSARL
jgi:hypothetical protein